MWFKTKILTIVIAMLSVFQAECQHNALTFDPSEMDGDFIDLLPYATMYMDSTRKLTIEDMQKVPMHPAKGLGSLERKPSEFEYPVWLKLRIQPKKKIMPEELTLYIRNGILMEFYQVAPDTIFRGKAGWDVALNGKNTPNARFGFPLQELNAGQQVIYIRLKGYETPQPEIRLYLTDRLNTYQENDYYKNRYEVSYYAALIVLLIMTGIFFLFRYRQFSERYLLWYGLYLIGMGIWLLRQYELYGHTSVFWDFLPYNSYLIMITNGIPWIFFALYLRDILEIKKDHRLYGYFKWLVIFLVAATVVKTLMYILMLFFHVRIYINYFQMTMLGSAIVGVLWSWNIYRTPEKLHHLIGTGMMVLTVACLLFTIGVLLTFGHYHIHAIVEVGLLIEIFFFNQAIGLRMKQTNKTLVDTQKKLLQSEQETLLAQRKLNKELNTLVEQKTQKILEKNKALAEQEKLKLQAEFNQKIASAELKALKAQMNPHFIFNCLNAIRNLVQKGQGDKATEYLADFASFIRKVLSYSEVKQISLEEELALCELYLKMEQLRFEDGFAYEIKVGPNTAIDFIMLPPMLLQPLLENAIWHGLLHKKGERRISVTIAQNEKEVICTIDDNGVGRTYSSQIKTSTKKDSMGMKLFIERLDINNHVLDNNYHYEIIDKYHNDRSSGTKVNLFFEL